MTNDDLDNGVFDRPEMAKFYDSGHKIRSDFGFCMQLAKGASSILDLGCGTGQLAADLSDGRRVVGCDPAKAMLDIAYDRPGGGAVKWVEGDARTVRLGEKFDLIMLTGHAYQVFLSDADQQAALVTIAEHLEPGGRFVFDSRNPMSNATKDSPRDENIHHFEHPELGAVEMWSASIYDETSQIMSYENGYEVRSTGEKVSAPARIRFTPKPRLAELIAEAGLRVDTWLGSWEGDPFKDASREIIPIGRLA